MRLLKDPETGRLIYCPEYAAARYVGRRWEDVSGPLPEPTFHCPLCAWLAMPDRAHRDREHIAALRTLMKHGLTF